MHTFGAGGRGSNPGRDMSVSGALAEDGDDLSQSSCLFIIVTLA